MILADVIKCTIPSENALKVNELYCNVAYPVASANSATWAAWAGVVVSLIAATVTFAAVLVAVRQSNEARRIAEEGNRQAIARELLARQWNLYERFAALTTKAAQTLDWAIGDYYEISSDLSHAANSYTIYLGPEQRELGSAISRFTAVLQTAGLALNEWQKTDRSKIRPHTELESEVQDWLDTNRSYSKVYMLRSATFVNELRDFYKGDITAEQTVMQIQISCVAAETLYRPLVAMYDDKWLTLMK